MYRFLLSLGAASLLALPPASAGNRANDFSPQSLDKFVQNVQRPQYSSLQSLTAPAQRWATGKAPAARIVREDPDGQLPSTSSFGTLLTPDGQTWIYTSELSCDSNGSINGAAFVVYDSNLKKYSSFNIELELGENETSINVVQLVPQLSKKFFDYDEAYEVMVYVHATTVDYNGHNYTKVYSLKDGRHIADYEGNNIGCVNTPIDEWSETFTMVFMREVVSPEYDYTLYFDVYKKADWSSPVATLAHTFEVDYAYVSGAGNAAYPFMMAANANNKMVYALPHYEKPFFEDGSIYEDPVATPDNSFVIDLYDANFELVKSTSIPMSCPEGYLYSFPGIGSLQGYKDLDYSLFSTDGNPVYIIGFENYETSSDDFIIDFAAYDMDGNKIADIFSGAEDYTWMSDVAGQEKQFCFYKNDENGGFYTMVDVPSCKAVTNIPVATEDGNSVSISLDRVAKDDAYLYVASMAFAEADADDNALHPIAWFGKDGKIDHKHMVNLGSEVALAQPYINADALNPYLFNTDGDVEYMFLVKEYLVSGSSKTNEYLRIYGQSSNLLLNVGPKEDGSILRSIFLFNTEDKAPKLIVAFYNYDTEQFTITNYDLPLMKFGGGDGSAENPYVLATAGDFMAISAEPTANYVVGNDIDFGNIAWSGNRCNFTGNLDGQNHTLKGINLTGEGIFASMRGAGSVSNLVIKNSSLYSENGGGFITGEMSGLNQESYPSISNVRVFNSTVKGADGTFGSIVGTAVVYSAIEGCSGKGVSIEVDDDAIAGGIAGRIQTSSTVKTCYFDGEIAAETAGGIVGNAYTSDCVIANCHVKAKVNGGTFAGGVIGDSKRVSINNCFVEGEVNAAGSKNAFAGGIAGSLDKTYAQPPIPVTICNNIVALSKVEANADAARSIAHRILGFSSIDYKEIDWDNVTDDMDPANYPTLPSTREEGLGQNYAIGLKALDANIGDKDDTSTEGETIALDAITDSWLAAQNWALGETLSAPWVKSETGLHLFFEEDFEDEEEGDEEGDDEEESGIETIEGENASAAITYDGATLRADGVIIVYNVAGIAVAQGNNALSTASLPAGVYMARTQSSILKFSK